MTNFKMLSSVSSLFIALAGIALSAPAFASVSVASPYNGEQVGSPFTLSANASNCSNQTTSAMGYSLDNSTDTTIVDSSSVNAQVQASAGSHTLHVKAWGNQGASCVTDVAITVQATTTSAGAEVVPASSISVSAIQALGGWQAQQDSGAGGSASGSMAVVNSPSRSGNARRFITSYSGSGDERYYVSFGDDTSHTNFLYDGWVYISSASSAIGNLEMDLNQTMSNGETVIFGFQCDGWNGTWDYTENAGSPTKPSDHWVHSSAGCNPKNWTRNVWHHVQVSYSRDSSGDVTYHSVWLDGAESTIGATVKSAFALGWGPTLLTNFQVDGMNNGTATVYLDDLVIQRW